MLCQEKRENDQQHNTEHNIEYKKDTKKKKDKKKKKPTLLPGKQTHVDIRKSGCVATTHDMQLL